MAVLLFTGACTVVGDRSGTEEPPHAVVDNLGQDIQVRRYEPRLAADIVVTGDEMDTRNAGFRKLAAFIFGENGGNQSIAMTAPVAQTKSEKIAMTAPVSQAEAAPGEWRVRFFMPAEYTAETLPTPNDPDIAIVEVPAETYAVIRFSGSRSPEAVRDKTAALLSALDGSKWQAAGKPEGLFYDPPWTLWFVRRNEVSVRVEPRGET